MRTLYFDCFAGASGNMILAALIALGLDKGKLVEQIRLLNVPKFDLQISNVDRSGISAIHVGVQVPLENAHRHLHHIEEIIVESGLSEAVKTQAMSIFTALANAEAKVHGIEVKSVHFHEVGAMDSIIDVVGACIGFDMLGIERFVCSKIHTGSGFAEMAHGKFPIPPPAVGELLKGLPVYSTDVEGELITPTGAAIISTICDRYGSLPEMKIEAVGYGAGTREYKGFPNALRLFLGESNAGPAPFRVNDLGESSRHSAANESLVLLETNIDDQSPQVLGYVMERALEKGALDCWFTPIQMKKNRPAVMVSMLCNHDRKDQLAELLYSETTTLGVRVQEVRRECLPRETVIVQTDSGAVDVKVARHNGVVVNAKPEYDQVRAIALKSNRPFKEVEKEINEKYGI